MKTLIMILALVTVSNQVETGILGQDEVKEAKDFHSVMSLAQANGFKPSKRIVNAILTASDAYEVDALELTAIAIIETGLGKNARSHHNSNGTVDKGLFQINTVNESFCVEYNLESAEGSALCAAKLISGIRTKHADYIGRYHSKTVSKKINYARKVAQVLQVKENENKLK